MLIDRNGKRKRLLRDGERKSLETDRVVLVHGPKVEVHHIQYMFDLFTKRKKTTREIAAIFNQMRVLTATQKQWNFEVVERILTNPKFIGTQVYNRKSGKLGAPQRPNTRTQWIVKENALAPIISKKQFAAAQALIDSRRRRKYTKQEILESMRQVLAREGTLQKKFFRAYTDQPGWTQVVRACGNFLSAYEAIGFKPKHPSFSGWQVNLRMQACRRDLMGKMSEHLAAIGVKSAIDRRFRKLTLGDGLTLSVAVLPFRDWKRTKPFGGWFVPVPQGDSSEIFVGGRMDDENKHILDYYIIPSASGLQGKFLARTDREPIFLEAYRSKDLTPLWRAVSRVGLAGLVS